MDWTFLTFLAEPSFVIPWYLFGVGSAVWVAVDLHRTNTPLKQAMKWAWPIIVLFFSVIGLGLYFGTARAPGIGDAEGEEEKKEKHNAYERSMFRRVNGAVIHCVAGDGLGIMTAMIIARVLDMTFWQEFWFEYVVGFAIGLFIFQLKSMKMMTDSTSKALWMAFRAEFFSMMSVMGGMGAVMTYLTPTLVGAQPKPWTYAFWGFVMFGLLLGYVMTFPMNWMLVKIGWKHGMGAKEGAQPVEDKNTKFALLGTMAVLGLAALALPAWLTQVRQGEPISTFRPTTPALSASSEKLSVLDTGLRQSLEVAGRSLQTRHRADATNALDAAMRSADVAAQAVPTEHASQVLDHIRQARQALQNGDHAQAQQLVAAAGGPSVALGPTHPSSLSQAAGYVGVPVLNAQGVVIGAVRRADANRLQLALGGAQNVWGFLNLDAQQLIWVPAIDLVFGPRRTIGKSYVVLPTLGTPPVTFAPLQ